MADNIPVSNRREQIINAAAELFFEKGYNMVSMQDIAQKIGLTKGALYNHIENKEELLFNIVTRGVQYVSPKIADIRNQRVFPAEKLKSAIYEIVLAHINYKIYVYLFQQENAALTEEHYETFVGYRDKIDKDVRQIIKEGIDSNCFKNINIKLATFAILGMCNWINQWYREEGEASPEEIAEFFSNVALSIVIKQTNGEK